MNLLKNKILFFAICLLSLLSWSDVFAQYNTVPYSSRSYPYIQYDSCSLEHFGKAGNLSKFYKKLDRLYFSGQGQVKVVQFGGSHMQAGIWPLEMRKMLESLSAGNQGAPGMVFPFGLAKTNHPFYYKSECEGEWEITKITDKEPVDTLGLVGITARTSDSISSIKIIFNPVANISERKFDKISVFHNVEDTSFIIKCFPENIVDTFIVNLKTRATEFYLSQRIDTLSLVFERQDTCKASFFFYGAYLENSDPGIFYSGIGVNGAATSSYLKAEYFKTHLKAINPDLVIFSIGVNDAAGKNFTKWMYVANYKKIANQILEVNPDCAFIFTTNNDFYHYRGGVNQHYGEVYDAMVDLSKHYNASVWNMFKAMGGYKSINYWRADKIANKDRIHFTREGYRIVAGLLFDAILEDYEKHIIKND